MRVRKPDQPAHRRSVRPAADRSQPAPARSRL